MTLRELFLIKRNSFFLKGIVTFKLSKTAFTLGRSGLHILYFLKLLTQIISHCIILTMYF
jgi:hypothetical protein